MKKHLPLSELATGTGNQTSKATVIASPAIRRDILDFYEEEFVTLSGVGQEETGNYN